MKPAHINCPSCGGGHAILNPGLVTLVCEYCGNAVYWDAGKVMDAGKQAVLPEGFSRLYRRAVGTFQHKRFVVLGRVRYSFGRGFWDEWYIELNPGAGGWLSEENHEFAWEVAAPGVTVPDFKHLRPGARILAMEKEFVIEEVGRAECLGLEGDLPAAYRTGETYAFADGSSPDGRYTIGIEYDHDPPTVFIGRWLKYAALELDDEGRAW